VNTRMSGHGGPRKRPEAACKESARCRRLEGDGALISVIFSGRGTRRDERRTSSRGAAAIGGRRRGAGMGSTLQKFSSFFDIYQITLGKLMKQAGNHSLISKSGTFRFLFDDEHILRVKPDGNHLFFIRKYFRGRTCRPNQRFTILALTRYIFLIMIFKPLFFRIENSIFGFICFVRLFNCSSLSPYK